MNKQAIPLAVRRHQLVATVREALCDRDTIVGVSGGADSIALLILCCAASLQKSSTFKVIAAHIHHGLREASDNEQLLVEQLCETLGVQCFTQKVQVEACNGSLAAGARDARYNALNAIAMDCQIQSVAVAHHAGDQLETMLMALCRGGGIRKLAGMASRRSLSETITLVRPLLHVEKSVLKTICKDANIDWCNDPTNQDISTPRGRLRKDVIPVLQALWPASQRHASNASSMLQSAADSFDSLVPEGTQWSKSLATFPVPVIAAAVHGATGEFATFETVQQIANAVVDSNTEPRTFPCGDGCVAKVTANEVSIVHS